MNSDNQQTRRGLEKENLNNEVHHDIRKDWLLKRSDLQTPEDILSDMRVLIDRSEDGIENVVIVDTEKTN